MSNTQKYRVSKELRTSTIKTKGSQLNMPNMKEKSQTAKVRKDKPKPTQVSSKAEVTGHLLNSEKSLSNLKANEETIKRYKEILKKVNKEFEEALKKNLELSSQVGQLEDKLFTSQDDLKKTQQFIDVQQRIAKDKQQLIEDQKKEILELNQTFTQALELKNKEIERLQKMQVELERRILD